MLKIFKRSRRYQLATLLTNSIFITIGVLTLVMVLQNYQVNREVVAQEVARTKTQTQSLVQEIFNFRLKALEIQQDSYSRSVSLIEGVGQKDQAAIDRFFTSIDQVLPNLAPDIRFLASRDGVFWDDGNAEFYGISSDQLSHLSQDIVTGNSWHISQTPSQMGTRYLMMRRSPVVNLVNGEVVAHLYIGVVLNNNFSLVNAITKGSNADELFLAVGSQVIASSNKVEDFRYIEWLEGASKSLNASPHMVSRTDLTIANVPTFLSVYTVQRNDHIEGFVKSQYLWMLLTGVLIAVIAISTRLWLGKRVSKELQKLMSYIESTFTTQQPDKYIGSAIEEFNQIGDSFELSFKRLNEQEKQFADLFNFSLSPVTLWSTDQAKLIRYNPAAERCFKSDVSREQLVEALSSHVKMCAQGATLTGVNTTIDGKTYRWNLSPIVSDNTTKQIMAQGQDITSFVEAERQSQAAKEEAEESARVRADFLAKMSHELRTPLNGILGVSQLLKHSLDERDALEHVEVLCNSGEHLLAVLNDILDFSKIEQGKFHIQCAEFRLIELETTVEKIFRPLCIEKGINLDMQSDVTEKMWANSDQVRLNQILFNLVSNAIKFTHHGHVTVSLSCYPQDGRYQLRMSVTDTGIGISDAQLATIFEPFIQAEATTTREYGGSGLGLAIVHSLAELMNGEVTIESQLDKGTRISATLPLDIAITERSVEPNNMIVEPHNLFDETLEVLLVEDNHTNAFIAKAFCEKYGMDVTWVQDGINAIEYLRDNPNVSLVLMDNQLPSLGGIESTRIIREELGLNVPIFACTADGMQDTKRAFIASGADYVIVKPIKELALNKAMVYFKEHYLEANND
ncbi:autoinducer 2 sensor kinase/phosphatase LuxQ [Vibrio sinaloensis DSM 21326]|uniref:Autoinducer 2 sensor kinase/phosphatase LuxQ n=1 Tax=Vibrio sinaloensis DSM 21326 TaxID=945550 RepID=E8M5T0_PHOS4|nr:quorum-sensing autoinducer 2 sensor kinase/phosphatase LuxQ [Vibrio sinaloensis]EGA70652.1 autoinducer 2 sensor kinase/phosphatase LuxQ [Vibrio sinaloensis DSM 21326]